MINFKIDDGVFNFRVAGLLFFKNKVLVHRLINDNFYAFPGGRVEMFESTENTIIREMNEELGVNIKVNRLLWICEHFFNHNNNKLSLLGLFDRPLLEFHVRQFCSLTLSGWSFRTGSLITS